jgi:hypothetical protein
MSSKNSFNLIMAIVLTLLLIGPTSAFAAQGQVSGTYQVVDTITVGSYPIGIAFNPPMVIYMSPMKATPPFL